MLVVGATGIRVSHTDSGMGGDLSPPIGGGHMGGDKGPMGGGFARNSRQNLEGSLISKKCV